ncbi:oxidoreductase [Lithospermum erythrorhizon]|uniref:Oxidoreductase n=1 Tax=Lithospermum erythrorhizon TaxID=34254 RepID=A0AAV3R6Q5_LITER
MRVVAIEEIPASKVFKCREEPVPVPKDDEVVINVTATGVTKMDVLRSQFEYELPPDWNPVPGLQCSGTIIDVGKDVHGWKCGDEVCALLNGGGYANAVVVRATQVLPLPVADCINPVACLPEAACTTWEALMRLCKLSANMTLLVYERCGIICD